MRSRQATGSSVFHKGGAHIAVRNVIADLMCGSDVEGVVLVRDDSEVIAGNLPLTGGIMAGGPSIGTFLNEVMENFSMSMQNDIFSQPVAYSGDYQMLARRITGDLTLLAMVKSPGYMGLAMLDIENSVRKIGDILGESGP